MILKIKKWWNFRKYEAEYYNLIERALGLDHSAFSYKNNNSIHIDSEEIKLLRDLESYGYILTYQRTEKYLYYFVTNLGKEQLNISNI